MINVELLAVLVVAFGVLGFIVVRSIRVIPQGSAAIVERMGSYHRTLTPGTSLVVPFIDKMRDTLDMREQVQPFPPQTVLSSDNQIVSVDVVVSYQVVNPKAATYEIANYFSAMEQVTASALRNVASGKDVDELLDAREEIANQLRLELAESTETWGVQIKRVQLKSIDPPAAIQESRARQRQTQLDNEAAAKAAADRSKAEIAAAEGEKEAAILRAQGEAQAIVLRAEAEARAEGMRAKGHADAIGLVARAIQESNVDHRVLAYQYIQVLPEIAKSGSNKVWVVPPDLAGLGFLKEGDPS
ncbi:MAG: SPFH/Band 7/PHB domain protein [Thermoactinospora sp.]|nr:SPFH/Band 7/PHB domain protein [Thermoactinospora sp.]